jgi:predicted GNAT superfamily acetyltransferase
MSDNLWAQYFKEREGFESINSEKGVISYKIHGEDCYIRDVFVCADARSSGEATCLADAVTSVAKERGCKHLTGSIIPSMPGSTGSLIGLLKYGFKLNWAKEDYICLIKEL